MQLLQLLEAAAEDVAVAALEAHHVLTRSGPFDEQGIDVLLGGGAAVRHLGDVDELDGLREMGEQFTWCEQVGDDDVGGEQRPEAGDGDQVGVAGSAADQGDPGEVGRA